MAARVSFSIAAVSPLGIQPAARHLTNDSEASDAVKWNSYNKSAMLPQKQVKGGLHIFHQNAG